MQAYPLAWPMGWPRCADRKPGKFNVKVWKGVPSHQNGGWMETKDLSVANAVARVLVELEFLGIDRNDAVISTNLRLRLDGLPRSDQGEPADPGAAVYWRTKGHNRTMAIDRYDRVADNLAAIAATLEAMRAIDRHGGAQIQERAFTGFDALPPPDAFDAWQELGIPPGSGADAIQAAFRKKAPKVHPDMAGGSTAKFQRLERARREALEAVT